MIRNGRAIPRCPQSKPADMWLYYLKYDPYPETDAVTILRSLSPSAFEYNPFLSHVLEHKYHVLEKWGAVIQECLDRGADIFIAHSMVQDKNLEHFEARLEATAHLLDPNISKSGLTLYSTAAKFPAQRIFEATTLVGVFDQRQPTIKELKSYFLALLDSVDMVAEKVKIIEYFLDRFNTIQNCMISYAGHYGIKHPKLVNAPAAVDTGNDWFIIVKPLVDAGRVLAAMKYTRECLEKGALLDASVFIPDLVEYSPLDHVIKEFPENLKLPFLALMFPKGTTIPITYAVTMKCARDWVARAQAIGEKFHVFVEFLKSVDASSALSDYSSELIVSMLATEIHPLPEITFYT